MLRLLSGYWFSQALYVVAALGIADRLAAGPRSAAALAAEARADADALFRLLRALASAGILAEGPAGFALTPLSETLRADRAGSLRAVALLGGDPLHWQAWGKLLDAVRSGQSAFQLAHGEGFFAALERSPETAAAFQQIQGRHDEADAAIAAALAPRGLGCIVDVGGGTGALARRIAEACPAARVILFDRPHVLAGAPAHPRVEPAPGDFLAEVPEGGDAYLLRFVLHDWDDERAAGLLARCRRAMSSGGRVFVVEVAVPEDATPSIAKTHDLNMLVLTGGRERTLPQYRTLLAGAGLTLLACTPLVRGLSLLEAA
jgi:hypothetical protein